MEKKNSLAGRISVIALYLGYFVFGIFMILESLSKNPEYEQFPLLTTFTGLIILALVLILGLSLITAIVGLFRKAYSKTLPLITINVFLFIVVVSIMAFISTRFSYSNVSSGEVTNRGVYVIPMESDSDGYLYEKWLYRKVAEVTDSVKAELGIRFGFDYVISGESYNGMAEITEIIKYPEPGLLIEDEFTKNDTMVYDIDLNQILYTGFLFEYEYELVSGIWEWEMWHKDKLLLTQKFYINAEGYTPPLEKKTSEDQVIAAVHFPGEKE